MKNFTKNFLVFIIILIMLILAGFYLVFKDSFQAAPNQTESNQTEGNCQDLCGNGECEEIVCQAIGCPCSETPETCPQDCE